MNSFEQIDNLKFEPEGWDNRVNTVKKDQIYTYIKDDTTLQGLVKKCDSGYNLHIDLGNGIEGIIPRAEIEGINLSEDGLPKEKLCTGKVHKFVQFKIKGEKDNNTLLLSRKDVQNEAINWIKKDLKEGQTVEGIVKNIKPYGAFIEIGGGVVGLAYIEDLSVARIKTPYERLKIGQKIKIVVKSINRDTGKVVLSYKETLGTWEDNIKNFQQGTKTKGIIRETEKNKNGIFIELAPNLVGMAEYSENVTYGQTVDVYIKKIDPQKKKVKLIICH